MIADTKVWTVRTAIIGAAAIMTASQAAGQSVDIGYQIMQAQKMCAAIHGDDSSRMNALDRCFDGCAALPGESGRRCLIRCREAADASDRCVADTIAPLLKKNRKR